MPALANGEVRRQGQNAYAALGMQDQQILIAAHDRLRASRSECKDTDLFHPQQRPLGSTDAVQSGTDQDRCIECVKRWSRSRAARGKHRAPLSISASMNPAVLAEVLIFRPDASFRRRHASGFALGA